MHCAEGRFATGKGRTFQVSQAVQGDGSRPELASGRAALSGARASAGRRRRTSRRQVQAFGCASEVAFFSHFYETAYIPSRSEAL